MTTSKLAPTGVSPGCVEVNWSEPTTEALAIPLRDEHAGYRIPRFDSRVEIRQQKDEDIRVIFSAPILNGVRQLQPAYQWDWQVQGEQFSWLMRLPTYKNGCVNQIVAYHPHTFERVWAFRRADEGGFMVADAFEQDGALVLNLELRDSERTQVGCGLFALRASDGSKLWEHTNLRCDSAYRLERKSAVALLTWSEGRYSSFHMVALDMRKGTARWQGDFQHLPTRLETEQEPNALIILEVQDDGSKLTSIDLITGTSRYSNTLAGVKQESNVKRLDHGLIVQGMGGPSRIRLFDAEKGTQRWMLDLPKVANVGDTREDGHYWLFSDYVPRCATQRKCSQTYGFRVVAGSSGELLTNIEIPVGSTQRCSGPFLRNDRLFVALPANDAAVGYRQRLTAFELPSGRLLWRGKSAQCADGLGRDGETALFVNRENLLLRMRPSAARLHWRRSAGG